MDIELAFKILGGIISAVVFIVVIKVTVDNLKGTVTDLKEKDNKQDKDLQDVRKDYKTEDDKIWAIVTKCREWQAEHEKEAAQRRLEIEREMGRLRESTGKVESQLAELVNLIKNLDSRLEKWIDKQA